MDRCRLSSQINCVLVKKIKLGRRDGNMAVWKNITWKQVNRGSNRTYICISVLIYYGCSEEYHGGKGTKILGKKIQYFKTVGMGKNIKL